MFHNIVVCHFHHHQKRKSDFSLPIGQSFITQMSHKTLEQIRVLVNTLNENRKWEPCHLFAFFLHSERDANTYYWVLGDETLMGGYKIKMAPQIEDLPEAKPGDIIRIHRLSFDSVVKAPLAYHKNVVVWPSFRQETKPVTKAARPTITADDEQRRRKLEALYCSRIFQINDLKNHHNSGNLLQTAGQIVKKEKDLFGHLLLTLYDGTATITARVFHRSEDSRYFNETNDHFDYASLQNVGNFIFINNVKLDKRNDYLNVSANSAYGKCLREVEKVSILGSRITHSIEEHVTVIEPQSKEPPASAAPPLRRSPRFQTGTIEEPIDILGSSQSQSQESQCETKPIIYPDYTKLKDIKRTFNGYEFYDIVGQVRSKPTLTRSFNNWVLQLYDGSKIDYTSFYIEEVHEPVQDCVVVLFYSKQKPTDTEKHIETVRKLHDGDLIMIKNVKASWKNDRLKLDLSANLEHGKSIEMIDKEGDFGRKLMEIVTNPIVEELLVQDQSFSAPSEDTSDLELEVDRDISV